MMLKTLKAVIGKGVQATVEGHLVQIGTDRWMRELGVDTQALQSQRQAWERAAKTTAWIALDGKAEALMGISDALKKDICSSGPYAPEDGIRSGDANRR